MPPVIECRDLTHYYGDKPALRGVSWELQPGRICGLLGRNGATGQAGQQKCQVPS